MYCLVAKKTKENKRDPTKIIKIQPTQDLKKHHSFGITNTQYIVNDTTGAPDRHPQVKFKAITDHEISKENKDSTGR